MRARVGPEIEEQSHLGRLRQLIELQYQNRPTGCGGSFGELLCWEIHENGLTFIWLARKWGISLPTLGDLISDHCRRLEPEPRVLHSEEGIKNDPDPECICCLIIPNRDACKCRCGYCCPEERGG